MKTIRLCPQCKQPLPPDAPDGLCPACLVKAGLSSTQPEAGATQTTGSNPGSARELPRAGDQFGNYRILKELGRGGMGAVYEAEQLESGRRVALKVLSHQLASPEARARFLREGRLAASINHPNSVYVFGTEEIEGTPVIVMELVAGGTLQERVQRQGPLPVGQAVDAALQLIAGLEAAHALGILHRDIKPSNCFEDSDGTVKIGDFGLSISTAARHETNLTLHGSFLGTPAFASPEQLRGEELNVRSDMYAVGVTLFYLLTGRTPFEAENMVQLLANVLEKPAPSPRKFRPDLPPRLASVVLRCLEKQPGERYRSYDELRQALAPLSSEAPVAAPLGLRFAAGLIDSTLLGAAGTIIGLSTGAFGFASFIDVASQFSPAFLRTILTAFLVMLAYYTVLEGIWGASAGKALCRLRVSGADRNPPGLLWAWVRAVIYLLLPVLPYWLLFGFNPYRFIATSSHAAASAANLLYYGMLGLLFCTARRHNGFAAVQDLLTRTRVIRKPAHQARPVLRASEEAQPAPEAQPMVGPYYVLERLEKTAEGEWLVGYDTRLLRKVWLHVVPTGTPPVAPDLRNLGRVGRLRWITGRRSPEANWDAYEAVTGKALPQLTSQPQPWSQVRYWLLDLANEISQAQKDGTLPGVLGLDRVWITADGRAKLLDFTAPGLGGGFPAPGLVPASVSSSARDIPRFLRQVAVAALEGRTGGEMAASGSQEVGVPLPLHGRAFLEKLPSLPGAEDIVAALKPLLRHAATVSRARRAALLAGCIAMPLVASLGFVVAARLVEDWQRRQPEIAALQELLQQRSMARLPWMKSQNTGPDEKMLALYIASHYRDRITNAASWSTLYAVTMISGEDRRYVEESVAAHPNPTPEEIAAADAAMKQYLPKKERFDLMRLPWFPFVVAGVCLLVYVGIPALLSALLFKGGLVLRVLGVAVVRRDGRRASRLRVFWRSVLAWAPFFMVAILGGFVAPVLGTLWTTVTLVVLAGSLVAWSLWLPERSLQDRLAGTCLVPR